MIDINEIRSMKQWTNDYKVRMFWDLVAEVERLRETRDNYRDIADTCLHAIKAGGDIRSGTITLIEHNLKLITGDGQ